MSTEIASIIHGRTVHSYDLLDQVMTHITDREEAHEAIHAMLADIIAIDGEDEVILDRQPIVPELLDSNPHDLDVYYWLTISDDSAKTISEAIAAAYAA